MANLHFDEVYDLAKGGPVNLFNLGIIHITVLALLVRIVTACWTGLTTDEANGVLIAITGTWSDMIAHLRVDGNPPFLYVVMRLVSSCVGHSDLAMKMLALTIGTLQIPLSYLICRQFLSRRMALQVAAMLALCPPLVRYSTLIRSYSLISLFSLLSTWLCIKTVSGKAKSILWPLSYGVSTACLVYCHYWGAFVPIGQALMVLWGSFKRWISLANVKTWLFGVGISILLFAFWLPTLYFQITHVISVWDLPPLLSTLVIQVASLVLVGAVYSFDPVLQLSLLASAALILLVLLSPKVFIDEEFDGRMWRAVTILGYFVGLAVSLFVPTIRERYLTPFAPLLCVQFITTFYVLFPRLPDKVGCVLPILLWLPMWVPQLYALMREPETSTPAIAYEIAREADRSKDLVVIGWPQIGPAITFYLPKDIKVVSARDISGTGFDRYVDVMQRIRDPKNMINLYNELDRALGRGGTIWLVDQAHPLQVRDYKDNEIVQGLKYLEAETVRMDQIRTWLAAHAQQIGQNKLAPGRDFSIFLSVYRPRADVLISPAPANRIFGPKPRQRN